MRTVSAIFYLFMFLLHMGIGCAAHEHGPHGSSQGGSSHIHAAACFHHRHGDGAAHNHAHPKLGHAHQHVPSPHGEAPVPCEHHDGHASHAHIILPQRATLLSDLQVEFCGVCPTLPLLHLLAEQVGLPTYPPEQRWHFADRWQPRYCVWLI